MKRVILGILAAAAVLLGMNSCMMDIRSDVTIIVNGTGTIYGMEAYGAYISTRDVYVNEIRSVQKCETLGDYLVVRNQTGNDKHIVSATRQGAANAMAKVLADKSRHDLEKSTADDADFGIEVKVESDFGDKTVVTDYYKIASK